MVPIDSLCGKSRQIGPPQQADIGQPNESCKAAFIWTNQPINDSRVRSCANLSLIRYAEKGTNSALSLGPIAIASQ